MTHHTSLWPRLAELPLVVEGYELDGAAGRSWRAA